MPGGGGRPADPIWFATGFLIGVIPGIYLHQLGLGLAIGMALGGALGLIREDMRRGYRRPGDPLWFCGGLTVGLGVGVWLHYLGLSWRMGLGLGFAVGLFLGAVAGTIGADRGRVEEQEKRDLARRYRD